LPQVIVMENSSNPSLAEVKDLRIGSKLERGIYHPSNSRLLLSQGQVVSKEVIDILVSKMSLTSISYNGNSTDKIRRGLFDEENRSFFGAYVALEEPESARDTIRFRIMNNPKIGTCLKERTVEDFRLTLEGRTTNMAINSLANIIKTLTKSKGKYSLAEFEQLTEPVTLRRYLKQNVRTSLDIGYPESIVDCELIKQFRGDETFPHGLHVAKWAGMIATHLNLFYALKGIEDRYDVVRAVAAGLLHDIGKVKVPENVLYSRERFDKDSPERKEIEKHPAYGLELLLPHQAELGEECIRTAHEHHERKDGKGYPLMKSGGEISRYADLIRCVDIFDALAFKRKYRVDPKTRREVVLSKEDIAALTLLEIYGDTKQFIEGYQRVGLKYSMKDVEKDPYYPIIISIFMLTDMIEASKSQGHQSN
jgi:HD-GYP domain-containing protein (c-di-GMP phosphodiesterase class II)